MDNQVMRPRLQVENVFIRNNSRAGQHVSPDFWPGRHDRGVRKPPVNLTQPLLHLNDGLVMQKQRVTAGAAAVSA